MEISISFKEEEYKEFVNDAANKMFNEEEDEEDKEEYEESSEDDE